MRRAVLTLAGTAAGLAALLSFKTHAGAAADAAPATSQAAGGSAPAPAAASRPAASTRSAGPASAAPRTVTVTGTVANTQYGPMQVQVTVAGQKITKVTVLQRTDDGSESNQIDSFAIPKLTSETLAAQSARIDTVSGASYTSSGYIQSLQSALDQARV
jgi:uncharacterized protein with FMN-binding domain